MEKKRKKLELRITFESDSEFDVFVDYFRRHRKNPRGVVLDALRLLWEPYVLADVENLSFGELERLIDISFQRYMSHYQLMCVELGLRRPGGFSPGKSDRNGDFSRRESNRNNDFSLGKSDRKDVNDGSLSDGSVGSIGLKSGSLGDVNDAKTLDKGKDDEASVDDLLEIDLGNGGGFDFD